MLRDLTAEVINKAKELAAKEGPTGGDEEIAEYENGVYRGVSHTPLCPEQRSDLLDFCALIPRRFVLKKSRFIMQAVRLSSFYKNHPYHIARRIAMPSIS